MCLVGSHNAPPQLPFQVGCSLPTSDPFQAFGPQIDKFAARFLFIRSLYSLFLRLTYSKGEKIFSNARGKFTFVGNFGEAATIYRQSTVTPRKEKRAGSLRFFNIHCTGVRAHVSLALVR